MKKSKIEWTDTTWNPITGCTKVSEGCKNCYAERMSKRLQAMGQKKYENGFKLTIHHETFREPYKWNKPRMVFVNSMSDLFHEDIPNDTIIYLYNVMRENPNHVFQVLTKRADRLEMLDDLIPWVSNMWTGVSVENEKVINRLSYLMRVRCFTKFVSCEPLLGPLDLTQYLYGPGSLDWVIVGGESGPKARPIKKDWVLNIKNQCEKANVPFFFKQWGGINKQKTGRLLEGKEFNEMPQLINMN